MPGPAGALFRATSIALLLLGCAPLVAPPAPPPPEAAAAATLPSAESRELSAYYSRVEASLIRQGLLRTDSAPTDAPFTGAMLARNFERVALFEEYSRVAGRLVPRQSASTLHRWERPIRLQAEFGASVPADTVARDRAALKALTTRLTGLTGLPIRQVRAAPNFHLFVVSEEERRALGPRLRQIVPSITSTELETITDLPRPSYCLVFAWDFNDDGAYDQAVAVIRAEHPDLLRLSCIHEEITQAMGLSNDSRAARPSIFNDDEEFALLTRHDELLLRILYSPDLSPGMTADEARPIVRVLAEALVAGPA